MNSTDYNRLFRSEINKVSSIAGFGCLSVIKGLSFFISNKQPILEIGAGIGTITKTLLENYKGKLYCHELNAFCTSELEKIKKSNYKKAKSRVLITSDIDEFIGVNFSLIVIDGPMSERKILSIIQNSSELKIIVIENYRLRQRIWVAKSLRKAKFRQQLVEVTHNEKLSASVFFVFKQNNDLFMHIVIDFFLVYLRIFPKFVLHLYTNLGISLASGDKLEHGFERLNRKTHQFSKTNKL